MYTALLEEQTQGRLKTLLLDRHPEIKPVDLTINSFIDFGQSIIVRYLVSSRGGPQKREEIVDLSDHKTRRTVRG
jgi:hypothetical protein